MRTLTMMFVVWVISIGHSYGQEDILKAPHEKAPHEKAPHELVGEDYLSPQERMLLGQIKTLKDAYGPVMTGVSTLTVVNPADDRGEPEVRDGLRFSKNNKNGRKPALSPSGNGSLIYPQDQEASGK